MSVITFWQFIIYAVSCSLHKKSNYQNFNPVSIYNIYHSIIYQFISIGTSTVLYDDVLNSSAVTHYYVTCHGFSCCGKYTNTDTLTIAYWYAALLKIKVQKGQKC